MEEYKIYALKYAGPLSSSGALMMWLKEWEETVERNYYIWCLKGEGEPVVVDAGVSPELAKERNLAGYVSPAEMLSRIGIKADEVRHVILTHIHWDHADGVTLFPNATIYIQKEEYRFWVKDPLSKRAPLQFFVVDSYLEYLASLEGTDRLVLLKGDREILPGIECLLAPGHDVALQAVAVNTAKGKAILGSDCAHTFRNYQEDWPSTFIFDLPGWMRTYDKLREAASSPELLFPGHDPMMTTQYEQVAEDVTLLV
ncbi:MAG: N-acyl homoserine lactonase family protein [Deltaproteobacteria bacterium]|nr:N-acyl homoserine lactonase family protein [Deltaproteobacteria bacterium]